MGKSPEWIWDSLTFRQVQALLRASAFRRTGRMPDDAKIGSKVIRDDAEGLARFAEMIGRPGRALGEALGDRKAAASFRKRGRALKLMKMIQGRKSA